ncbi:MAG: DNA-directed RNA polymerase I subunit RPA34 [Microcoleus sp.]
MTELNHQELAKQGNPQAIASLLASGLQSADIAVTANLSGDCLEIILEADRIPDCDRSVELVRSKLANLQPESIRTVKVEGRETGQQAAAWMQEFSLDASSFSQVTSAAASVPVAALVPRSEPLATNSDVEVKTATLVGLENRLRTTLIVVGIVTGILAIAVAAFVNKNFTEATANTGNNLEETGSLATGPDTFRDAVNKALEAQELGRSAKSKDDWVSVADRWQEAVSLMRRVPQSSPHHDIALTKVVEYQKYLVYAQESAASPPPPIAAPAARDRSTSEKENRKKSTTEKATKEKENSKKSTLEKSESDKENSKKSTDSEKVKSDKENSKKSTSEKSESDKN